MKLYLIGGIMPKHENLRGPLSAILQEDVNSFWLAYQILNRMRQRFPNELHQLEGQYGTGYGEGGGHNYRPDSAIALCLCDWPENVETRMIRGNDLSVGNIRASGNQMGIYRWIGPTT
jgi:hypothetical protein